MIRTTAPIEGQAPYKWDIPSARQCTWFAYFRTCENSQSYPCYFDRATRSGSYTNAKLWLENYREPWQVKGADFKPSSGDIAVFTGEFGHVVYIEEVVGDSALISDYNRVAPLTYASDTWKWGTRLNGCGELIGYLHYPYEMVETVERDKTKNQIHCADTSLRIRTEPNTHSEIVGYVQDGYYNVLDMADADGYTWYKIKEERWCANIGTTYLPSTETDFVAEIKRWADNMIATTKAKDEEIANLSSDMRKIDEITKRWL